MAINLPLEQPVVLSPDPDDSAQQVAAALATFRLGRARRQPIGRDSMPLPRAIRPVSTPGRRWGSWRCPTMSSLPMPSFGSATTEGLDRARGSGWRGTQQLRWKDEVIVAFCAASTA